MVPPAFPVPRRQFADLHANLCSTVVDSAPPFPAVERWTRGFVGAVNSRFFADSFGSGNNARPDTAEAQNIDPYYHPIITPFARAVFSAYYKLVDYPQFVAGREEVVLSVKVRCLSMGRA